MPQCQRRHLLRPLNHQRRLHPRNQFPHRHGDPLLSVPAAIICLKEVEYVAPRMGYRQPAFTCVPATGDGADADDILDTTAQDIADTQVPLGPKSAVTSLNHSVARGDARPSAMKRFTFSNRCLA